MRPAIAAALLLLSGCGAFGLPSPADNPEVEPTFRIYYSRFLSDAARFGAETSLAGLKIRMAEPQEFSDPRVAGSCGHPKTIKINRAYWENMRHDAEAELLLYHELGHCTLGQEHRSNSVMDPGLRLMAYIQQHAEYLTEFLTFRVFAPDRVVECETLGAS